MINPSLRSLVFSLITASSLVALSSSSYAMDPELPKLEQLANDLSKERSDNEVAREHLKIAVQILTKTEKLLKNRQEEQEEAMLKLAKCAPEEKTEILEDQPHCETLIKNTEKAIQEEYALILEKQKPLIDNANKNLSFAMKYLEAFDKSKNPENLRLAELYQKHAIEDIEYIEKTIPVYSAFPEEQKKQKKPLLTLKAKNTEIQQRYEKSLSDEKTNDSIPLSAMQPAVTPEVDNAKTTLSSGIRLYEMDAANDDMGIHVGMLKSYKDLLLHLRQYHEEFKQKVLTLTQEGGAQEAIDEAKEDQVFNEGRMAILEGKIRIRENFLFKQQMDHLRRIKKGFKEAIQGYKNLYSSNNQSDLLQPIDDRVAPKIQLLQEVQSSLSGDREVEEKFQSVQKLAEEYQSLKKSLSMKTEGETKAAVPQIPTATVPAPKLKEAIPAVITVSTPEGATPAVRPTLERGTPPPPPGPLVSGHKGKANKPATGASEVANPQRPQGSPKPNPKAPPPDLMAQIIESHQQRAAKQNGEQPLGKAPIPQIERSTKVVFSLKTSTAKERKDVNNPTLSSQSTVLQNDLNKQLSPGELEVQNLELKLAGLPNIMTFANLTPQDKTVAERTHNTEKDGIYRTLTEALKKVKEEKTDALEKLENDLHTLSQENFAELPPAEKSKKEKEHLQRRKELIEKINIAKKERIKSYVKKIDIKIQYFTWKDEESMRMRKIHKSRRAELKSIIEKREQEIEKKNTHYAEQLENAATQKAAGLAPLDVRRLVSNANEILPEIDSLKVLQKRDKDERLDLNRPIRESKTEVEKNTKEIDRLKKKKLGAPSKDFSKKIEKKGAGNIFWDMVQSIEKQKGQLVSNSPEEDDPQGGYGDDVVATAAGLGEENPVDRAARAKEEAEKRARVAADAKLIQELEEKRKVEANNLPKNQQGLQGKRKDDKFNIFNSLTTLDKKDDDLDDW